MRVEQARPTSTAPRTPSWRRDSDLAEIDEAVQGLKKRGLSTEDDIKGLKKEDFPLPTLGPKLVELALNATHGRGFQFITCARLGHAGASSTHAEDPRRSEGDLLHVLDCSPCVCRGFPVIQYKHDRFALVAAYWAIGLHIGRHLVTQHDFSQVRRRAVCRTFGQPGQHRCCGWGRRGALRWGGRRKTRDAWNSWLVHTQENGQIFGSVMNHIVSAAVWIVFPLEQRPRLGTGPEPTTLHVTRLPVHNDRRSTWATRR